MIGTLLIGGLAGWLTGRFTKGEGYGILMNIALGILGGWLFGILGLGSGDGFIGLWNELAKNGHRPNYTKIVNN
jgi:uncharacterized membrane protein YeaQ/YmgE (transglycosylase-associated protein family)